MATTAEISDYDYDFAIALKAYYARLFPGQLLVKWLGTSLDVKMARNYFANREIAFTLEGDIYMRYLSFPDWPAMKKELGRLNPIKIDIGAVYNLKPKEKKSVPASAFIPLQHEFVLDIDMTDYDPIRTCCSETAICRLCWSFMTLAIRTINIALTADFGFEKIMWVYSGRRGVHCWVADERAREMSVEARRGLIGYLECMKGGKGEGRRVNNFGSVLHPHLARSLAPCATHFQQVMMGPMGIFSSPKEWQKVLACLPDDQVRRDLDKEWTSKPQLAPAAKWEQLKVRCAASKKLGMANVAQDIVLQYGYARLDSAVSVQLNHLLKSPFCVHPKTGYVCVPIDPSKCTEFDPFAAPKLADLHLELLQGKPSSLDPHVQYFKRFVDSLAPVDREALRSEEERNLEF